MTTSIAYYTLCIYINTHTAVPYSLMQIAGDLDALQSALSNNKQPESKVIGAGKCSALVKLLPNNADLFVSHDTWEEYQGMLRIYKLYDLKFTLTAKVKGECETVSGA